MSLTGKQILILGGAVQHCKLVEAAHNLGVITHVADHLSSSPAKIMADHSVQIDIFDTESLHQYCNDKSIDGVAAAWLDSCQMPYYKLCSIKGYPCYGSKEAFSVMTNKERFKAHCASCNVDTIPYQCGTPRYLLNLETDWHFPLFIKPVDSRGSRGQGICKNKVEMPEMLDVASKEASNGHVIVERYMGHADDISVTYFFIDGVAHLERLSDRILGDPVDGLENIAIGSISPSMHEQRYMNEIHENMVSMLAGLGCKNGPAFVQGLVDEEGFYFYDPGLRFPGGDYERAVQRELGIDYPSMIVEFALTGRMQELKKEFPSDSIHLFNGNIEVIHDITLRPGVISSVEGLDSVKAIDQVVSVSTRGLTGERIPSARNVNRRFTEVNYIVENIDEAIGVSQAIQNTVKISDEIGDMKVSSIVNGLINWKQKKK